AGQRAPPVSRRRTLAGTERRAIEIGVAGTVLVHLLLFMLVQRLHWPEAPAAGAVDPADSGATAFDIQLAPDEFPLPLVPVPVPPPPAPTKFVEANPAAPDNTPDQTNNFAAQNQQAAQTLPTPDGKSDTPAVKGDPARPSTAIVSGELADPRPLPRVAPSPPPTPVNEQQPARRPQTPLPGTEQAQGETPAAIGTGVAAPGPNTAADQNRVDGQPGATADTGFTIGLPVQIDPQHPQPRPQLTTTAVRARPSPLVNNFTGTNRTGITAYDAKWNRYGEYLQRLIDAVAAQWHRILEQSSLSPEAGTRVQIVFRLNARGEVAKIISIGGNGNAGAQEACVSGITVPAPYGPWSADMVALLGESQDLTFTFYIDYE
ncbi:MAG: hypothetical protein WCL04_09400, partial [Verrucomicrobiota bacterium]